MSLARSAVSVAPAEFPAATDAAMPSRRHGMPMPTGTPDTVRGASRAGNVSAREQAGLLDIPFSECVPFRPLRAVQREGGRVV
jgi:alpha-D-ribose 1-methylphosphonate 5-triphosphate diphosphatase